MSSLLEIPELPTRVDDLEQRLAATEGRKTVQPREQKMSLLDLSNLPSRVDELDKRLAAVEGRKPVIPDAIAVPSVVYLDSNGEVVNPNTPHIGPEGETIVPSESKSPVIPFGELLPLSDFDVNLGEGFVDNKDGTVSQLGGRNNGSIIVPNAKVSALETVQTLKWSTPSIISQSSFNVSLLARWRSDTANVMCTINAVNANELQLLLCENTGETNINRDSTRAIAPNTIYWLVFRTIGSTITVEHWTEDPALPAGSSKVPSLSYSIVLPGGDPNISTPGNFALRSYSDSSTKFLAWTALDIVASGW